jgi:hypothetical protein
LQSAQSANPNGPQVTPKDELNAQLQARQKYIDVLTADLQLQQTEVNLLRQTEGLGAWVLGSTGTRTLTPSATPLAPVNPPLGGTGALPSAPSPQTRP